MLGGKEIAVSAPLDAELKTVLDYFNRRVAAAIKREIIMSEPGANDSSSSSKLPNDERWAREVLGKLALAAVTQQRRARRWNIFFKLLFFGYLVTLLVLAWPDDLNTPTGSVKRHTASIKIDGLIASSTEANANAIESLRKAFKDDKRRRYSGDQQSRRQSSAIGEIYDEISNCGRNIPRFPFMP